MKLINIFKDDKLINDVKILFDGLRNIGICVALISSLPFIEKLQIRNFFRQTFVIMLSSLALILFALNVAWVYKSLTSEPLSKKLHLLSSIIFFILVTIAIAIVALTEVWPKISILQNF